MTEQKHLKRRVRARMKKTGERYASARRQVVGQAQPAGDLSPDFLKEITGMSNDAVEQKTGRNWNQWIAFLDQAKARQKPHRAIVELLAKEGLPPWWRQMVTVGYERVRGLRQIHQKADGFSANKSKTIGAALPRLYHAWADPKTRRRWLEADFTIRTSHQDKSMRITWTDGTHVDVNFYSKGENKSLVTVEHRKLENSGQVQDLKRYWSQRLERLAELCS